MNYSQRLNLKMRHGEMQKDEKGGGLGRKKKLKGWIGLSLSLNKKVFITVTFRFPLSALCVQG